MSAAPDTNDAARADDAPTSELLAGWGRTAPTHATVVHPHSVDDAAGHPVGGGAVSDDIAHTQYAPAADL